MLACPSPSCLEVLVNIPPRFSCVFFFLCCASDLPCCCDLITPLPMVIPSTVYSQTAPRSLQYIYVASWPCRGGLNIRSYLFYTSRIVVSPVNEVFFPPESSNSIKSRIVPEYGHIIRVTKDWTSVLGKNSGKSFLGKNINQGPVKSGR